MVGLGLGSANPATPPPSLPLGSAVWSPGAWFDLITVAGADGAPISSNVASLAGANVLAPESSPKVNVTAIGGNRGCFVLDTLVQDTQPMWRCDALAALFTGGQPFSVFWDWRGAAVDADGPQWAALSSAGGSNAIGARIVLEKLAFRYSSPGTGTVTIQGAIPLAYDYHRLGVTYDGTTLQLWVDGVPDTSAAMPALAISLNRFSWLGSHSSVAFEGATGFARRFAMTPSWLNPTQVATVDAYFVANDWTLLPSNPLVPEFFCAGASICRGTSDLVTGAGYRAGISDFIIDNRLSWRSVGDHPAGWVPYRDTPSLSGQTAEQITTQCATFATARTRLVTLDLGNAEINSNHDKTYVEGKIATALANIRASIYAVAPTCQICVYTILPYFEAPFNAVAQQVNADLSAIWDASDAAFPSNPKLLRFNGNAAIGGPSYVQANYPTGDNHPNNTGYNLIIPALLAASSADGVVLSDWLLQQSPT